MGDTAQRIFLGWQSPFLRRAVERWLELLRERDLDPSRCVVVLPGRRAARRVEELIAELAPPHLAPPRVVPDGSLAAAVASEPLALATQLERALLWRQTLLDVPAAQRAELWASSALEPAPPALADLCARTLAQLWAEDRDASEIAALADTRTDFGKAARWRVLADAERRYRTLLRDAGRVDPAEAARALARSGRVREDVHVSLFAVVDLSRAQRALLARLGGRVTSFVFAPDELAQRFDELGGVRVEDWAEREVALDAARWRVVDTPDEQALAVVEHLATLAPSLAPEDVSIGVPDLDVLPFLERRLFDAGCEPRWAGGERLAHSRPARLIAALRDWLAEMRFDAYAALARHPDLERLVEERAPLARGEWPATLDQYARYHLPARADGTWLDDRHKLATALTCCHAALLSACGEFVDPRRRTLGEWADALGRLLIAVWPEIEPLTDDGGRNARALAALAEIVEEARGARSTLALSAHEVLELLCARWEPDEIAPVPVLGERPVIELFGWLELALDDARELVLTGVNEGSLPEGSSGDAWLFEGVRRELGLTHEARRVARDTWALSAILASRPGALLVSGRRSSRRDPRTPSRFVFRCAREELPARVERAWPRAEEGRVAHAAHVEPYLPPRIAAQMGQEIAVTAFKTYLQSPYLFYLVHVLRLETLEDRAHELDGAAFGRLAHGVLQAFGEDATLRSSTDPDAIREFLHRELDARAKGRFGDGAQAAVRLQIEKLRWRLERFARWQAEQCALGWEIQQVEFEPARVLLGSAGRELALRGKIDRLDYNASEKRWRVLDYKTGDAGKSPRALHLQRGGWIDLQLPLYRHLLAPRVGGDALEDGYVVLDKSEGGELFARAEWKDGELDDALAQAHAIVDAIQRGEFDEVGELAPREPIFAALSGFGLLGGDDEEDER